MEEKKEVVLVKGMFFKKPNEKAPDFVKGNVSIKMAEFIPFIKNYTKEEWLNIDLLKSQKGTFYFKVNTYKPTKDQVQEVKEDLSGGDYQDEYNKVAPEEIDF